MRFIDRKATKPNRYKATPEEGNSFYVVLERADEPTEEGTPLNAAMLNIMASLSSLSPAMMDDGSNGTGGDNSVEDGEYEPIVDPTTGLPVVTEDDNGKVLKVVDGAWVAAEEEAAEDELPTVTTEDNGKVLRVVNGAWAAVAEAVELVPVTQGEYDALVEAGEVDETTLYLIVESDAT